MGHYLDVECTLATCVFHDDAKHGCDHYNAVNRNKDRLLIQNHTILASRFVIKLTTKFATVCNVASNVIDIMDSNQTLHSAINVASSFVWILDLL